MNTRSIQTAIFSFVFMCNLALAAPAAADVALRDDTEVNRGAVKLSDVFDGLPEGVDCDIARSPAPGKSITYDTNVIAHLVKQYKLEIKTQPGDHITIRTASTKITQDDIRAAVIEKVKEMDIQGDIDVVFDNRLNEVILPADRPANFTLNNFNFEGINKRFRAELAADGFSGPINVNVMGHVVVKHNVPVFAHRLEAGTLIGSADINWISVPEDRMADIVTSAEALVNHELKSDTEAGKPVKQRDVMQPRFVVRGSMVTMKIETPMMTVTAQGRALQDGRFGDTVRVLNTQSNRTIEGVVEGDGLVGIHTTRKLALASPTSKQD